MSLNNTPSSERVHIGIFGRRNAGKSSIINALTGQSLAIVSDVKGTTTDPVLKAMELLPLGPVVMIDTPGLDDEGALGSLRVQKAYQVLNKTDIAVLVVDGTAGMTREDLLILDRIKDKKIPYVIVMNKADLAGPGAASQAALSDTPDEHVIWVSAADSRNIHELKELIASLAPAEDGGRRIVGDLIHPSDFVVLVVPIDKAAPKGRLILPQQMAIRDLLDAGCVPVVCRETELARSLAALVAPPALVVTDSQAFGPVSRVVPDAVPLTSFSILMLRYKADLALAVAGAAALDRLRDGDRVLISEGCTHHRQCEDIGTVKMPAWLAAHTGAELALSFTSGADFPDDLTPYAAVIHCGGCTLTAREMRRRQSQAADRASP